MYLKLIKWHINAKPPMMTLTWICMTHHSVMPCSLSGSHSCVNAIDHTRPYWSKLRYVASKQQKQWLVPSEIFISMVPLAFCCWYLQVLEIIIIVLFLNCSCNIIMVSVHCSVVCQNRNGCSGNGDCVLGVCQCDTGHTGTHCETSECYIMLLYWKSVI